MKTFPSYREKYFLDPVNGEMFNSSKDRNHDAVLNSNGRASSAETRYTTSCSGKDDYYRLQRKVMFSVILFTRWGEISPMDRDSPRTDI